MKSFKTSCSLAAVSTLATVISILLPTTLGNADTPPVTDAVAQPGNTPLGFALTISTEKSSYTPQVPIDLLITLKNTSGKTQWPGTEPPTVAYDIKVTLPNGQDAPLTLYGKQQLSWVKRGSRGGNVLFALKPEEEQHSMLSSINRLFDMTLAGTYKIVINRRDGILSMTSPQKVVPLTSNVLTIEVHEVPFEIFPPKTPASTPPSAASPPK